MSHLFSSYPFSESLKQKYIQLLEKFEVALKISPTQVYIYVYTQTHCLYIIRTQLSQVES